MKAFGLDIFIESPRGSIRYGDKWTQIMRNDYGYIKNTIAIDGDEVDCFLGDDKFAENFYVVNQINPETGEFDEFKVMLGFPNMEMARRAYMLNYQHGWQGFNGISKYRMKDFKTWYAKTLEQMHANS